MKKFITILATFILMSIAYTAQAQFISRHHTKTQSPPAVMQIQNGMTATDFLQSDVYQDAIKTAEKGRKQFFAGITCSLIGSVAVGVAVPFLEGGDDEIGGPLVIGGGICTIVGTVLEISGASKWAKGEANLRNLRFEYTVKANGLVISF